MLELQIRLKTGCATGLKIQRIHYEVIAIFRRLKTFGSPQTSAKFCVSIMDIR